MSTQKCPREQSASIMQPVIITQSSRLDLWSAGARVVYNKCSHYDAHVDPCSQIQPEIDSGMGGGGAPDIIG